MYVYSIFSHATLIWDESCLWSAYDQFSHQCFFISYCFSVICFNYFWKFFECRIIKWKKLESIILWYGRAVQPNSNVTCWPIISDEKCWHIITWSEPPPSRVLLSESESASEPDEESSSSSAVVTCARLIRKSLDVLSFICSIKLTWNVYI